MILSSKRSRLDVTHLKTHHCILSEFLQHVGKLSGNSAQFNKFRNPNESCFTAEVAISSIFQAFKGHSSINLSQNRNPMI